MSSEGLGIAEACCCGNSGNSGSCGHAPPRRQFQRIGRVDKALVGAGKNNVLVDLDEALPLAVDSEGRIAHVLALHLRGTLQIDVTAATNAAMTGEEIVRTAFASLFLRKQAWDYLAGVDAADIMLDAWLRTKHVVGQAQAGDYSGYPAGIYPAGIPTNHGVIESLFPVVDLEIQCSRKGMKGPAALEESILLSSLIARSDALTFSVPSAVVSDAGGTNLATSGFATDVECWADIVWLDPGVAFLSRDWQLESYTTTNRSGTLRHKDRSHEYVVVAHYPEDNGGRYIDDYAGITAQCDDILFSSLTLEQWEVLADLELTRVASYQDSVPPYGAGAKRRVLPIVTPTPGGSAGFASGPATFQFASRTRTETRFLHRTVACQDAKRAGNDAAKAGLVNPTVAGNATSGLVAMNRGVRR